MAPSQPESDPLVMFGYSLETSQDNLFDGAPEPALGAPLLTETDSKFLTSFFEDITSNQYNMPSFGEGLNFSDAWLDLPPQFMGSSTSYGAQEGTNEFAFSQESPTDMTRMLPVGSNMMPPPPPPPPTAAPSQSTPPSKSQSYSQQPPDDVLNAAATLVQNGSRNSSSRASIANSSSPGSTSSNDQSSARRPGVYPVGHLRHQQMEEFKEENRRSEQAAEVGHTFTRWMWGSKEKAAVSKTILGDFQWGSDSSFSNSQGYVPESRKDSAESVDQSRMKYLDCLGVKQDSAGNLPTSPLTTASTNGDGTSMMVKHGEEDVGAPPRKRRKSKNMHAGATSGAISVIPDDEEDDEKDSSINQHSNRKRKTKSERSASGSEPSPDSSGSGSRRRKSVVNGSAKTPRENLTEEQKRENHIRSEQKRRTLIKEGFDDLGELVPGLKGGTFSKSTTLSMAAEWLEELLRGNKALTTQVLALEQS